MSDLIVINKKKALEAFSVDDGLQGCIDEATAIVEAFEHDLSTAAGRKKTASLAHKVSKLKTRLDGMGKDLVSDWKKKAKAVDSNRKKMRDALDCLRDQARAPLTEWEQAEESRINNHKERIRHMSYMASIDDESTSKEIEVKIKSIESIVIDGLYEEFEPEAREVKYKLLESLNTAYKREIENEIRQAEIERLRKEKQEREKREYDERLKREAAEKARKEVEEVLRKEKEMLERQRAEAEARAIDEKKRAEQAERERIAAIERAKREAEQAAEKAREEERQNQKREALLLQKQKEKREADRKHVADIRRKSKEDIMINCNLSEDQARLVVICIDRGEISNIKISY